MKSYRFLTPSFFAVAVGVLSGCGGATFGEDGHGGQVGTAGDDQGGSDGRGTGGKSAGGAGGETVCCELAAACGENERTVPSMDDCPVGSTCREVTACCSTVVCATVEDCDPANEPYREYVSDSVEECATVDIECADSATFFSNACGCGCETLEICSAVAEPGREYVVESPDTCALIDFGCPTGTVYFSDECGCGCETSQICDPQNEPNRSYVSESAEQCRLVDYGCPENTVNFDNDCGCGCEQDASCPEYVDCMPGAARVDALCTDSAECPYTLRAM